MKTYNFFRFQLLFDFLAFKNDVSFWSRKRSLAGLSARTVFWRAFSQFVIALYLLDEHTSLLVVVPAGISAVIEVGATLPGRTNGAYGSVMSSAVF